MAFKVLGKRIYELLFGKKEERETAPKISSGTTHASSVLVSGEPLQQSVAPEILIKEEEPIESEIEVSKEIPNVKDEIEPPKDLPPIEEEKVEEKKEEFEWPQDDPDFIKNSVYSETWNIPQPFKPSGHEKYGFDKPLIIKMISITNPQEFKIFISVKQMCEYLSVKPKKVYASLDSENKTFNSKYKLEIIPFSINEEKNTACDIVKVEIYNRCLSDLERQQVDTYFTKRDIEETEISDTEQKIDINIIPKKATKFLNLDLKVLKTGTEFSSGTNLQMRIKNLRKNKFVSIADKCPELIKEWDEINNGISADKVPHALKEKAFWICQICGKSYERRIDNRTRRPNPGCTKCVSKKSPK